MLSAIEPNRTVHRIADALSAFMGGMNQCRCVVATRFFRAPATLSWPRFRILRLSPQRQRRLIVGADLVPTLRMHLLSALPTSSSDIRAMSSNPLFLGLLCEHMKETRAFPQHSHTVFESYCARRFSQDRDRVIRRFQLTPADLMETAETVAFVMIASPAIGLSPTRAQLSTALTEQAVPEPPDLFRRLDALEYLKLARSEAESVYGAERPFTFSHRRFQEYFATLFVLRDIRRVPAKTLLTDGRWRETAVVTLQTQPRETIEALVHTALDCLRLQLSRVVHSGTGPANSYVTGLHILGILQDGFAGRAHELPPGLRVLANDLITAIAGRGTLTDEKRAVEHAGIIPSDALEERIHQRSPPAANGYRKPLFNSWPGWSIRQIASSSVSHCFSAACPVPAACLAKEMSLKHSLEEWLTIAI